MKRFRANYAHVNPDFYILNLLNNPANTPFDELLDVLKRNFATTYPSPMSNYLKNELGNITNLNNLSDSEVNLNEIGKEDINDELLTTKLLPTAIMRFQLVLIELLRNNYLKFDTSWNFNILLPNQQELEIFQNITYRDEFYGAVQVDGNNAIELAIIDLQLLLNDLLPDGVILSKPFYSIKSTIKIEEYTPDVNAINIDFSLFKTYEEDRMSNPHIIYIRTDFRDDQDDLGEESTGR